MAAYDGIVCVPDMIQSKWMLVCIKLHTARSVEKLA